MAMSVSIPLFITFLYTSSSSSLCNKCFKHKMTLSAVVIVLETPPEKLVMIHSAQILNKQKLCICLATSSTFWISWMKVYQVRRTTAGIQTGN